MPSRIPATKSMRGLRALRAFSGACRQLARLHFLLPIAAAEQALDRVLNLLRSQALADLLRRVEDLILSLHAPVRLLPGPLDADGNIEIADAHDGAWGRCPPRTLVRAV